MSSGVCRCLRRPEEEVASPGTRVIGNGELQAVGAEN